MKAFVMMVEDDRGIREALSEVLEVEGYNVVCVANGKEALTFLNTRLESNQDLPALVLLDLMMPVMDGWQFRAEQLKDARISSIPVVVMTADGQAHHKIAPIAPAAFVKKPIEIDDFLLVIEQAMSCRPGLAVQVSEDSLASATKSSSDVAS